MADPVTLQDIYDLFKASQADLQASREEFDRRMAENLKPKRIGAWRKLKPRGKSLSGA